MVNKDVLIEKVNQIQNCLGRIHLKVSEQQGSLDDLDIQDIVVLNLQRAIQTTVDIATHVISAEKLSLPQNLKDTFFILESAKIINKELAEKLAKMVGFRNIAVHEYSIIDAEILKNIIQFHLKDIEEFYSIIIRHYKVLE